MNMHYHKAVHSQEIFNINLNVELSNPEQWTVGKMWLGNLNCESNEMVEFN